MKHPVTVDDVFQCLIDIDLNNGIEHIFSGEYSIQKVVFQSVVRRLSLHLKPLLTKYVNFVKSKYNSTICSEVKNSNICFPKKHSFNIENKTISCIEHEKVRRKSCTCIVII